MDATTYIKYLEDHLEVNSPRGKSNEIVSTMINEPNFSYKLRAKKYSIDIKNDTTLYILWITQDWDNLKPFFEEIRRVCRYWAHKSQLTEVATILVKIQDKDSRHFEMREIPIDISK